TGVTNISSDDQGVEYAGGAGGSTFTTTQTAFELTDSDANLYYGLTFAPSTTPPNNARGIYAHGVNGNNSRRNTILGNTFLSVYRPVMIDTGSEDIVKDNTITNAGPVAIELPGAATTTVQGNSISGATDAQTRGITADGSTLTIKNNTITRVTYGILLGS